MLRFWRGSSHGGWDPRAAGMGNYTVIIGAQTLHAVGYAMGIQRDGADAAAVAYFGDGATSQGDVAEAFTFAAVSAAPVVFFCQNNQWAISEPAEPPDPGAPVAALARLRLPGRAGGRQRRAGRPGRHPRRPRAGTVRRRARP